MTKAVEDAMWIKICGIRDAETALAVAALKPDALGLNFYAGTPRVVDVETATEIVRQLPAEVEPVGVFVNQPAEEIRNLCDRCGIRTVQLHGDEPPELVVELQQCNEAARVIRAWRLGSEGLEPLTTYLAECDRLGAEISACLIDARVAGLYGGSGQSPPWAVLSADYRREAWPPLILAGGLTPENVAGGIRTVCPWGVDVSSGVESRPGEKDLDRVRDFITAGREAFAGLE